MKPIQVLLPVVTLMILNFLIGSTITSGSDNCKDPLVPHFEHRLLGHVYNTITANVFFECLDACLTEKKCQSINMRQANRECQFNNETKQSRPTDFVHDPSSEYMTNFDRGRKGSQPFIPGHSCLDILDSGDSNGDGEYWIDPATTGNPFTVYCDMTTDGGGWTLVHRLMLPLTSERILSDDYRDISKYRMPGTRVTVRALNLLRKYMKFNQFRYYCHLNTTGTVLHLKTKLNARGEEVVRFFTNSTTMPVACGSYTAFSDDTSRLSRDCHKWGDNGAIDFINKWGRGSSSDSNDRLYISVIYWEGKHRVSILPGKLTCDNTGRSLEINVGDKAEIYVR